MDGACSAHGGDEMITQFPMESLEGRDRSEDLGTGGRIIFKKYQREMVLEE
jgi:hypothetical protein